MVFHRFPTSSALQLLRLGGAQVSGPGHARLDAPRHALATGSRGAQNGSRKVTDVTDISDSLLIFS